MCLFYVIYNIYVYDKKLYVEYNIEMVRKYKQFFFGLLINRKKVIF